MLPKLGQFGENRWTTWLKKTPLGREFPVLNNLNNCSAPGGGMGQQNNMGPGGNMGGMNNGGGGYSTASGGGGGMGRPGMGGGMGGGPGQMGGGGFGGETFVFNRETSDFPSQSWIFLVHYFFGKLRHSSDIFSSLFSD